MSEAPIQAEEQVVKDEETPGVAEEEEMPPLSARAQSNEDGPATDDDDDDDSLPPLNDNLSVDSNESEVDFSPDKDPTDLIIKASTLKEEGNAHFKSGDLAKATRSYRKGTNVLKPLNKNNSGDDQVKALLISLQNNLSMVCYKQNKPKLSLDVASKALNVDPANVKALYRRAVANRKLGNAKEARDDLKEALKHEPNNAAVRKELISIKKEMEESSAREKKQLQKAFSNKSGGRFLYDDKVKEERKKAEEKKKKQEEEKEALKKRKVEWENECVKRMANGESAISFEEWEKEEKKLAKKLKKEQEEKKEEAQKKTRAEASQMVVDDHDSDEELTESELAMLRGYKKTSDGRTTSYFTRELSEEEKKILGDTAPQKLGAVSAESSTVISPSPLAEGKGKASAWNQAGTLEEKNTTDWCTPHLQSKLLAATASFSGGDFVAVVTKVEDLSGDASVAVVGGKKRYIFDYAHTTLLYEVIDDSDDTVIASGSFRLPDICSTSHDELEVDVLAWKKPPTSEHESNAAECRTLLVSAVQVAVQEFVQDFNAHY
jgi:tetratricopeptide (TPR) repeat protein